MHTDRGAECQKKHTVKERLEIEKERQRENEFEGRRVIFHKRLLV